ncbi:uncharacterized protein KY384_002161 [Bacidia gigantensis]|uniref:uncharacterized protein n=1 Tax=Bacidia gigantensis TaxID=2732470 RepID=UPI001D03E6C1|nr:uncharacterized protein KY384_002161 [Bacidia gigantensis]KAG8533378.1 hypothetical protein KY384_002161 [Bacidia gigantensis]
MAASVSELRPTLDAQDFGIPPYALVLLLFAYLLVVALVRYQRLRETVKRLSYGSRESLTSMTLEDAFYIQLDLAELEFPFTFHKALQFALFRTYGIPSISKLLVQTSQLSNPLLSPKRYVDTEVLVSEFYGYHPQSDRAIEAISRMNFIHSTYRKAGKISNNDLLYTLSLFALEPIRWINRYEWRQLESFEKNAIGVFAKALGDAMSIEYEGCLKSAKEGWADGLQWLDEVEAWAEEYEKAKMVPDVNNFDTAEQTVGILLWYVPGWAKGFGKKLVCTLMDDRLRTAMV